MAAQQNFRSAFNGFNREDVVQYIQYLNTKHASEISQLNSELEYLRSRQTAVSEEPAPAQGCENCAEKDNLLEALLAEADELKARIQALEAENQQLRDQQPAVSSTEAELEAYRRAERVERKAQERAELVYHRVNGTLADATVKVEDAAAMISGLTERVTAQLSELQNAVLGSRSALKDAADTMYSLRPEAEE